MFGPTGFEEREERGLEHWDIGDEELWVEARVANHPDWWVRAWFFIGSESPVLQRVDVEPISHTPYPATPLTVDVLRSIRPAQLYKQARAALEFEHHDAVRTT